MAKIINLANAKEIKKVKNLFQDLIQLQVEFNTGTGRFDPSISTEDKIRQMLDKISRALVAAMKTDIEMDDIIKAVAKAIRESEAWSTFWSEEDSVIMAEAAVKATHKHLQSDATLIRLSLAALALRR